MRELPKENHPKIQEFLNYFQDVEPSGRGQDFLVFDLPHRSLEHLRKLNPSQFSSLFLRFFFLLYANSLEHNPRWHNYLAEFFRENHPFEEDKPPKKN